VGPATAGTLPCASPAICPQPDAPQRLRIDELIVPLRAVPEVRLNAEVGERLRQVAPIEQCLCVLVDRGCAGLDAIGPRLHGNLPAELQRLYLALIFERDPLLARAAQDWGPLIGTVEQHCTWIHQRTRHADVIEAWLLRAAAHGAEHLVVVPARGWLSRGGLFAFFFHRPTDSGVFALFYAAQRLATALELRYRPYTSDLLTMRLTAREREVLRASLRGTIDRQIAQCLGMSVDAVRYYFTRFKHRAPAAIGHLKPRELARVLHELGTL
jgi:DNA-binding CsgD family transcriptional regulator